MKIIISKHDTKCSDAIGYTGEGAEYYSWEEFCREAKNVNWLGFSVREVRPLVVNDRFMVIECVDNLVDDYLLVLAESTAIDFSYTLTGVDIFNSGINN